MPDVERERVLAFRAARQGLAERRARTLAEAASWPASDFQRGSALLALAARSTEVTRDAYDRAVDSGEVAVAHSLRAAIHAQSPADVALFGRALVSEEPGELLEQLGEQAKRHLGDQSIEPRAALDEVERAAAAALEERGALDKNELHAELRARVRRELMPWCQGCGSHHVVPMLWRYALVRLGARRDAAHRYVADGPAATPPADEAVRRFLGVYGPSTPDLFAAWAGVARSHARRLWRSVESELEEVPVDGRPAFVLARDRAELDSPPAIRGTRLLPPGDPFLQHPNRATLVPDTGVRKRAFRPVASPGIVLRDGEPAALWRSRARRKRLEVEIEPLAALDADAVEAEAERIARLRSAESATVTFRE